MNVMIDKDKNKYKNSSLNHTKNWYALNSNEIILIKCYLLIINLKDNI